MEFHINDKVKFKSINENNEIRSGKITEIIDDSYLFNRKFYNICSEGEVYLNIPEGSIISYFPVTDCIEDECVDAVKEQERPSDKYKNYKRGDCVYLINDPMNVHDHVIITAIYSDNTIGVIDLLGRVYVLDLSNTFIKRNFGNIIIPGFGEVNETRIPVFDDFKYHYGDIVTYTSGLDKYVGRIESGIHIEIVYTDLYPSSIEYQIINIDSSINALRNYNEIEPGDYRMKEQENKITMEDIRNCFDDDFAADGDDKCDAEEDYRCSYQDKIGCPVEIFTGPLAPLQSFKDISEIRFDKPEITIVYSNGGESNVELPKNAYNKKVGFLLAYLKGILDDIEYARVAGIMESINKEPQQIIVNLETYNEDD